MAKIKAKLRSMDLRGEKVTTKWGDVTFSQEGLAELEVDEKDLQQLRDMKLLNERPAQAQTPPEPSEDKTEDKVDDKEETESDPLPEEPGSLPEKVEPEETTPQGGKKSGKANRR